VAHAYDHMIFLPRTFFLFLFLFSFLALTASVINSGLSFIITICILHNFLVAVRNDSNWYFVV